MLELIFFPGQYAFIKLEELFFYLSKTSSEKLFSPISSGKFRRIKNDLLGSSFYFYHFNDISEWFVYSPIISGKVEKVFLDYSIKIVSNMNLQIVVRLKINSQNLKPRRESFFCHVIEGDILNKNSILYSIFAREEILCVVIHVLWQPELIKKISFNFSDNYYYLRNFYSNSFATVYYLKK